MMLTARVKRGMGYGLVHSPAVRMLRRATCELATIFVLHRFEVARERHASTSVDQLRDTLSYLRRNGYQLVSVMDVVRWFEGDGPPLHNAVAFTVDDGYEDQATVGAPVFAEFDCPLTIFLTTGFLDGQVVPWWDLAKYVFESAEADHLRVAVDGRELSYPLRSDKERFDDEMDFLGRCKDVSDGARRAALDELAAAASLALPEQPLPSGRPMSWDQARALERMGVDFGPHTVSHPVLSQVDDRTAENEIAESWRRLGHELDHPVPVFCYPNGRLVDFGDREIEVVRALGLRGAVTVDEAQADPRLGATDPDGRFRISRLGFPPTALDALFCVTGLDRAQRALQRRARPRAPVG